MTTVMLIVSPGCALFERGAGVKSECARIAGLSDTGEHKPAVDAAREMELAGQGCPPDVAQAVERSRAILEKADSHVRKALQRKKEGNLLSARANLKLALDTYPRYYWVQNLIRNIDRSIRAELDSLRNEASYHESRNDLESAHSRVLDALKLAPGDKDLKQEASRLEKEIARARERGRVKSVLDEATGYLAEGRFDDAQRLLTRDDMRGRLGKPGEDLLNRVRKRRDETIDHRFAVAAEMEKKGDLDTAAGHATYVLELLVSADRAPGQIVEFARLLGMKLYSAGELSKAREVWEKALAVDPGNMKLQGYLREVDTRLDNLDRIKKGRTENGGN
ncbi:MAG: hypothetical protein PVJ01_06875 [Pseudomonadota bacterium]